MKRTFQRLQAAVAPVADQIRALAAQQLGVRQDVILFLEEAIKEDVNVPFVARYRRHRTDGMNETEVEKGFETILELRAVFAAREKILADLEKRQLLTPDIKRGLDRAVTLAQIEAIYQPFRVAKKTNAAKGREKGLDKFSDVLLKSQEPMPKEFFKLDAEDTKLVQALVVEAMYTVPEALKVTEEAFEKTCHFFVEFAGKGRKANVKEMTDKEFEQKQKQYKTYHERRFTPARMEPHQILAINRGETQGFLKVNINFDPSIRHKAREAMRTALPNVSWRLESDPDRRIAGFLSDCWTDAFDNHIAAHCIRLLRANLKKQAEGESIRLFRRNLTRTLTQRPLRGHVLLAVDPGFGNGCKWAILSPVGEVYAVGKFFLPKDGNIRGADLGVLGPLKTSMTQYNVTRVVVGDGTGSYEAETFVLRLVRSDKELQRAGIQCCRSSEQGASIYSASQAAQEELGHLDLLYRSAVSIGRRVLDPLSELVKIPVQSVGVGLYQHDVPERALAKGLDHATVSTVARIGVDFNSASEHVLGKVPGVSANLAKTLVAFRSTSGGAIKSRAALRGAPGVTKANFEKFAGFIRVPRSPEPLDDTSVHPESYALTRKLLEKSGAKLGHDTWQQIAEKLQAAYKVRPVLKLEQTPFVAAATGNIPAVEPTFIGDDDTAAVEIDHATAEGLAKEFNAEPEQVVQILDALCAPRADPRDSLPFNGLFKDALRDPAQLKVGTQLYGRVLNVVAFGAWIDIGVKSSAFMHASNLVDEEGEIIHVPTHKILGPCDIVKCIISSLPDADSSRADSFGLKVMVPRTALPSAMASRFVRLPRFERREGDHPGSRTHTDGAEPTEELEPVARRGHRRESADPAAAGAEEPRRGRPAASSSASTAGMRESAADAAAADRTPAKSPRGWHQAQPAAPLASAPLAEPAKGNNGAATREGADPRRSSRDGTGGKKSAATKKPRASPADALDL
jgi:uncharacterized protein